MGDITAHWCGTVWETAETLLNFNSRDLWCIWYGGTGVERHLGVVIYLCNFRSDLVRYDFNLRASFIAHSRVRRSALAEREAGMLFFLAGDHLRAMLGSRILVCFVPQSGVFS